MPLIYIDLYMKHLEMLALRVPGKSENYGQLIRKLTILSELPDLHEFFIDDLKKRRKDDVNFEGLKWVDYIRVGPHEIKAKLVN